MFGKVIYIYINHGAITFKMLIPIKKMMHNNKSSWRTYYYLLPKPACQFLLWKANGWSVWSYVRIHGLCSQTKNKWSSMSSLHLWLKPWNNTYVNFGFMCYNNFFWLMNVWISRLSLHLCVCHDAMDTFGHKHNLASCQYRSI